MSEEQEPDKTQAIISIVIGVIMVVGVIIIMSM